jgi:gamma-glutamylcyclotransferase (GGCT)/AIG2-like uncharacterized protein YtfP
MDKPTYVFVYGSLRKRLNHPLHGLLEKQGICVTTGYFQGKLYDLGRYPGAVPSHGKNDRVPGELYRLTDPHRILQVLDTYEGTRFTRKRVAIALGNGNEVTA